jgi:sterol desaturase/sphingolipid hydroxylase (fatty acid hydroxylase superfamily)
MLPLSLQLLLVPAVLLYENFFEWATHKYLLHGMGRKPGNFWKFHWVNHHGNARKHQFLDPDYQSWRWEWNARTKEILMLGMAAILHSPILAVAPLDYLVLSLCAVNYYRVHRKAHLDVEWCKQSLPWHYDHHMAQNQDANWCVTFPFADWAMGTRERFINRNARKFIG